MLPLAPISMKDLRLTDKFWSKWQETVRERTLHAIYDQMSKTGRLENFRRAAAGSGEHEGYYFNDSDVYKWLEACAYALAKAPDQPLRAKVAETIHLISSAQEPTGYLNTYFQLKHPNLKWRNVVAMHEMYCIGHLIEAAVAFKELLDEPELLQIAIKAADEMLAHFAKQRTLPYPGHEEIELALVKLARVTGEPRYREAARSFIERRGTRPSFFQEELRDDEAQAISPYMRGMMSKDGEYTGEYSQDHLPIREHVDVVGHAVRAMYLYIAAADFASDDPDLRAALERVWTNLVTRRMYVTGGIGPSGTNEGFTLDYDLPNLNSYAETCAACGLVFWGARMLQVTGDGTYADIVEKALYNGALSGISASGDKFFYANPLESRGNEERTPWFSCACCPPNIARLIGSVGQYIASISSDAFWLHIPAAFETEVKLNGTTVKVSCQSNYPWSGKFILRIDPERPAEFEVRIRIPEWAEDVETELPGLEEGADYENGYAVFKKKWMAGDTITVDLGMSPRWIESNPRVLDNLGRVALASGPLVYCAEAHDNMFSPQTFTVDLDSPISAEEGEPVTLRVGGFREKLDFPDELYSGVDTVEVEEAELVLRPYYDWCNRGPNAMQVWIRR